MDGNVKRDRAIRRSVGKEVRYAALQPGGCGNLVFLLRCILTTFFIRRRSQQSTLKSGACRGSQQPTALTCFQPFAERFVKRCLERCL